MFTEPRRRLAAILCADVAGYSRLMGDDESDTVASLEACRDVFRREVDARDGRVVDTAGDSVLAVFDSVVEAVEAAQTAGRNYITVASEFLGADEAPRKASAAK